MVNHIFDENELNKLRESKSEIPSADAILSNEERIQGIEYALEDIIRDYDTHDMLLERFGEPKVLFLI